MKTLLLYIVFLTPLIAFSQTREELDKEYKEIHAVLFTADSDSLISVINSLIEKAKNIKHDLRIVNSLHCIAWIYEIRKEEYDVAIVNYLDAIKHAEKSNFETKEEILGNLYNSSAITFSKFNFYKLAEEYYSKALQIIKNKSRIIEVKYHLTNLLIKQKKYVEAIDILKSLILVVDISSIYYYRILNRLAVVHYYKGDFNSSISISKKNLRDLLKLSDEIPHNRKNDFIGYAYHNIALSYDALKFGDSTEIYFNMAINSKRANRLRNNIVNTIVDYSQFKMTQNKFIEAKQLLLEGEEIMHEINRNSRDQEWYFELYNLLFQVSSELEESEATIYYNEKYEEELAMYTKYHQRYNMNLIVKNYFEKIENEEQEASLKHLAVTISGSFLALLVLTLFIYLYQKNRAQKKLKQKSIDHRLSELKALKAQINPHFLFNVLNSIQSFILENEKDIAQEYLVKYGRLMRKVLDHSDSLTVTLADEIETLRLYTDLEMIRVKEGFNFTVTIDSSIYSERIIIPSMVIQPFIENAIWHGVSSLKTQGEISLIFTRQENMIYATIKDNGVGFDSSGAQQKSSHKSKGIQIVKERLSLLWDTDQFNTEPEIHSKKGIGTKIILKFPDNL